ncbi:hypothetical protein L3Q67_38865 [Saccharothrix sp. AJ9571]|nr:hypothetical protein L3Q67_38865 [Saccharothrix sp. AJ9571]
MSRSVDQSHGRRPSGVPRALAVTFAALLALLALSAAWGWLDAGDDRGTTFGTVLRIVLAIDGGCTFLGAVLLGLRWPVGRILTAVGGGGALALPVLVFPAAVVAPSDSAYGIREIGGPLVLLVLILFGLITMVQSLRRDTRDAVVRQ